MTDPTAPGVENFFRSYSPDEENDKREKSTLPGTAADQEDAYDQHGTRAELQVGMQTTATTGNVADASTHLRLTKSVESQGKEQEDSAGYGESVGRTVSALGKSLTTVGASSLCLRLAESVCSLVALVVMSSNLKSSGKASLKFNSFSSYMSVHPHSLSHSLIAIARSSIIAKFSFHCNAKPETKSKVQNCSEGD